MKHTILSLAIAAIFASCSNNKPAEQAASTPAINSADTIGLSDYKEWKQTQEAQNRQTYTSPGVNETAPPVAEAAPQPQAEPKPKTVVIYRDAPVRQSHTARASYPQSRPVYKEPVPKIETPPVANSPVPEASGTKREPYGRTSSSTGTTGTDGSTGSGTSTSNNGDGDVVTSTSPAPAETPAKKDGGWSKAAKDGAIGGASGAVLGAIFSKNKTKGAVIGGVVGAAGGYIFGKNKDKKDAKNQ